MPPRVAEHLDQQVRAAVDDLGVLHEVGGGVDHAQHLDHAAHPREVAQCSLHRRDQVQSHLAGMVPGFSGADFAPYLGHGGHVFAGGSALARQVQRVAVEHIGVEVATGCGHGGQHQAQLLQALFRVDGGHAAAPW